MSIESLIGDNFFTTKVSEIANWARKNSLWPMPFGTACCAIEYMSVVSSHYDVATVWRRGRPLLTPPVGPDDGHGDHHRQDGAGAQEDLRSDARARSGCISMGACATSGGFYRAYHVMQGIDEIIPVDVYIPGCPPTPEAVIQAILMIRELIENENARSMPTLARELRERMKKEVTESSPKPLLIAEQQARGGGAACSDHSRAGRAARIPSAAIKKGIRGSGSGRERLSR